MSPWLPKICVKTNKGLRQLLTVTVSMGLRAYSTRHNRRFTWNFVASSSKTLLQGSCLKEQETTLFRWVVIDLPFKGLRPLWPEQQVVLTDPYKYYIKFIQSDKVSKTDLCKWQPTWVGVGEYLGSHRPSFRARIRWRVRAEGQVEPLTCPL